MEELKALMSKIEQEANEKQPLEKSKKSKVVKEVGLLSPKEIDQGLNQELEEVLEHKLPKVKEPKVKEKKPRPPKTEKQLESFRNCLESKKLKNEERLLEKKIEASKLLLELKKKKKPKYESDSSDSESDSDMEVIVKKKKCKKSKKSKKIIIQDSSDSSSSSGGSESDEPEPIPLKQFGKTHQNKKSIVNIKIPDNKPKPKQTNQNLHNYFCN